MGFCRRCGDIVAGPRCKCGGTSVAAVVKWNQDHNKPSPDRWSRTYVTKEKSIPPSDTPANAISDNYLISSTGASTDAPAKRFPRPNPTYSFSPVSLSSHVSAHIASATTSRPPSPLKNSVYSEDSSSISPDAAAGILPNPNGSELAKVYGSILQPQESLATYTCALCSSPFPPDATIYPDPSTISSEIPLSAGSRNRFLCCPCFTENGGSKGNCPTCHRPVLILKSEGAFIENGGGVWHKNCFNCSGCFKNIGDTPMVDLLGRPSCTDCFDSCLKRPAADSPQRWGNDSPNSNLGGTKRNNRSREGSPALEELEQRLGIVRSRESTPTAERTLAGGKSPRDVGGSPPKHHSTSNAASPTVEQQFARVKGDTSLVIDSSPFAASPRDAFSKALQRFKSPEPDSPDEGSPVRPNGTYRLKTPDFGSPLSDGSPRRSYNRFKSPEPDTPISSPASGATGSPLYGSSASKQSTEEAIDEMKRRFLRQISPSASSGYRNTSSSATTTPTRQPRLSNSSAFSGDTRTSASRIPRASTSPSLKCSGSAHSLRSSIRQDVMGGPDYTLRRDRTGNAEVESLLGTFPQISDLIDLESPEDSPNELEGSLSTPPLSLSVSPSSALSPIGLGLRMRTSMLDLKPDYPLSVPNTPGLASDMSDTTSVSQSSPPSTPPSISPPSRRAKEDAGTGKVISHVTGNSKSAPRFPDTTPTPKSKTAAPSSAAFSSPTLLSANARCAKCGLALFSTKHGGKFVTVPELPGAPPKTYHTACFRCTLCEGMFEETEGGRAVFVRGDQGVCHLECAPPEKIKMRQITTQIPKRTISATVPLQPVETHRSSYSATTATSSRYERPPPSAPPSTTSFTSRFGGSAACPGCSQAVSPMERGVVPGPQGTRWHATCLLCGGKDAKGRRKEAGKPGCGKKLDSAAKNDRDGGVWCRECLLLLPAAMRQSPAPVRSPVVASHTGGRGPFGGVAPQLTGTTTIARQFTGLGGPSDATLLRQMTGGGLSPTRQLTSSPTKMYDGPRPGAGRYPRPKSVTGMRSDSGGRGMFLVRQLTGGNGV
ncbi:hypothetical protein BKA93DRAFT_621250 [Sparassis latifolia]|uniref:LIM zinc-binding domain-containing protein n=1 Tax=Sparassis crispa TaxID=139825 RepID=A0A401G8A0_9APHY|nr:hypothetical protein SCP_0112620 [Sparassis crispa]GBE78377.1 hypothetical protein SCP_0112620 [Sparassis crispa]